MNQVSVPPQESASADKTRSTPAAEQSAKLMPDPDKSGGGGKALESDSMQSREARVDAIRGTTAVSTTTHPNVDATKDREHKEMCFASKEGGDGKGI